MNFWNENLRNMEEYIPGEQPQDIDQYIKLNTNENPFPPSETVLKAIREAASQNLRRYPEPTAMAVREEFAKQNNILPENIFVGNGSDEIFTLLFRGFIEKTGVAAFPYPSYALYCTLADGNGIKYEKINLNKALVPEMNDFLKKKFNLVIIANPNNPTGTYTPVESIKIFLDKFKGLLVVDEAYIDFYGGSAIELVKKYNNVVVTRSFSKSYSLAGLRVGLAIANAEIIRGFNKLKDSYNVDMLAIAGAKAALLDKRSFNYNIEMLINNKEYLESHLESLDFEIVPSKANFIFVKHKKISSKEIYEQLKERKILVRYFSGPIQSDYIRITVGTMSEIKALCKELKVILGA